MGTYDASNRVFACVDISTIISIGYKFDGAATAPNGLVVFAPLHADCVGFYDVSSGAFACVALQATVSGTGKFRGAAIASNSLVVFAPYNADSVGTLALTFCDDASLACGNGTYRASCGTSAVGLIAAAEARAGR